MLKVKYPQKTNKGKIHTTMNILTQKTNFRQSVVLYSLRNSVFATIWRILRKLTLLPIKPPSPKYIPKPYEPMLYPGQRVQVDVKVVPKSCIVPNCAI